MALIKKHHALETKIAWKVIPVAVRVTYIYNELSLAVRLYTTLYSITFQGRLLYIEKSVLFLDKNISIGWVTSVIRCAFVWLFVSIFSVDICFFVFVEFKFPYLIENIEVDDDGDAGFRNLNLTDVCFLLVSAKYMCIIDLCFCAWTLNKTNKVHYYTVIVGHAKI